MKNHDDLVSIIMPTYNSEKYVADSIQSVIAQDYRHWELLITDDGSTDKTPEILKKYTKMDSRVKQFSLPGNSGAAVARNNSILCAKGKFIAFLDSDDLWDRTKLTEQVDFMIENGVSLSFGAYRLIDQNGKKLNKVVDDLSPLTITYHDLLAKKATFGCLTVMFKKEDFSDFLMPLLRRGQDYALWLKLLRNCDTAYRIQGVHANYRIVSGSISRNKITKALVQWDVYRNYESLSLSKSIFYFISYSLRAILVRIR